MSHLLKVVNLVTGYEKAKVLHGVDVYLDVNEVVAIIGHNGAGKSTLLKAIFGLLPVWEGKITFDGFVLNSKSPHSLLSKGIVYVPQGNRVFSDLTVRENFEMGGTMLDDRAELEDRIQSVVSLFPELSDRLSQTAGTLSGGEKQMLTLGNALILSPRLILFDEPSLGLDPPLVKKVFDYICRINSQMETAILVVEQKIRKVMRIAQRVYVLRNGRVSFSGAADELDDDTKLRDAYL